MRRQTAAAAAILLAGASAACAELPSAAPSIASRAAPPATFQPLTRVSSADLDQGVAPDPFEACGAGAAYRNLGAASECRELLEQLRGVKSVTVEFSNRYQALAAGVQIYTRSWVTHVDFVLPDGRLLGATPAGVRIRKWTPAIHSVRYTFDADAEKVLGFALAQVGKPYDYVGLSGYALKISILNQPGSWFCSALVQAAALQGGVDLSGKAPKQTSPARIKASALLTRVEPERTDPLDRPMLMQASYQPAAARPSQEAPEPAAAGVKLALLDTAAIAADRPDFAFPSVSASLTARPAWRLNTASDSRLAPFGSYRDMVRQLEGTSGDAVRLPALVAPRLELGSLTPARVDPYGGFAVSMLQPR